MKKFTVTLICGIVLICSVYLIYTYTMDDISSDTTIDTIPDVTVEEVLDEIDGSILEEDDEIEIGAMV